MAGIDRAGIIWREVKTTGRITIFFKLFGTNAYMFPRTLSIMLPLSLDMLVFNCTESTDRILTIYHRIRVFWSIKMDSNISDVLADVVEDVVIVDEANDTAKRVYTSEGNTPGKPDIKKTRRRSSSRTLFQSPGTSPKPAKVYIQIYTMTIQYN
jgi:hypothetical protein